MTRLTQRRPRAIVALDIDGAVSPVTEPGRTRPSLDIERDWEYLVLPEVFFGSIVAEPVRRLLLDLDAADHARRLWHSSWWTEAHDLDDALGLRRAPMLGSRAEYLRDQVPPAPNGSGPMDWKTAAVLRTLASMRPDDRLIWVDDEIESFVEHDGTADLLDDHRLVMVHTQTRAGIDSQALAVIRAAAGVPG